MYWALTYFDITVKGTDTVTWYPADQNLYQPRELIQLLKTSEGHVRGKSLDAQQVFVE